MSKAVKIGQKGRKIGRAGRKPAHKRYNTEMRWMKNKERRIAKQARFEAKKASKKSQ
jgi:hypothetical protein